MFRPISFVLLFGQDSWCFFASSRYLLESSNHEDTKAIPPLGGPERKLAEIRVRDTYFIIPPYLAWCPDSNCLIVTDSPGEGKPAALFVVALESGEKRQLTNPQPPAFGDTNPTISPDGRWLVYRRRQPRKC